MPSIRAKVICVFQNGNRILVTEGIDPARQGFFYVPPGGGIEFGESSEEALQREMREELDAEIIAPRLLGVLENVFTFNGRQGHEIVFVYDAEFADRFLYGVDRFEGRESDGQPFNALWLDFDTFGPDTPPVYPEGLLEILKKEQNDVL